MKICRKCLNPFPSSVTLDGKRRVLTNRTQCLTCLPYGESPYRKKTVEEKRSTATLKMKKWMDKKRYELGMDPISYVRKDKKKQVVDLLGGCCSLCKYDRCRSNLAFHHLREKSFTLDERRFQYSWLKLLPEILKCVLVCHNCHGEIHSDVVDAHVLEWENQKVFFALDGFIPRRLSLARAS